MATWNEWAARDALAAGIDLAHSALMDVRRDYGTMRDAARALLAEGLAGWQHPPELAVEWPAIVDAAESHLRDVAASR